MGLLAEGTPLSWEETIQYIDYIKRHGIAQFVNLYHKLKFRERSELKWGDEVEYTIVKFDDENKKVRVSCRASQLLKKLKSEEERNNSLGRPNKFLWTPEFGAYMIEGTPGSPYGGLLECFSHVEEDMKLRRKDIQRLLREDESILSMSFPSFGVRDFTSPPSKITPENRSFGSIFWPDEAICSSHLRFKNLLKNSVDRRGSKIFMNVPIFKDSNTPDPYVEDFSKFGDSQDYQDAKPDHIYLDHMGFGMGCCCLQVTFQTVNVGEARWLYDQLTPITPVLLALSAATPIFRSKLSEVDTRWGISSASCDDRTEEERGLKPLENEDFVIEKSRYDSTNCYIDPSSVAYNDIPLQYDENLYQTLIKGDIDEPMAKHIAHLFIRDPLQVYFERIEQDDAIDTEHFETIQSSNWMNMRFKPPPVDDPKIGWRVEFRPTEVQLTDFENAAYCCFIVLLTRVLIAFRTNYLIPISQVTENMKRAQIRDAVRSQKFFFRKNVMESEETNGKAESGPLNDAEIEEMTVDEIVNGKEDGFPGLMSFIRKYLDSADLEVETLSTINQYLELISKRASGEIPTLAHWMRDFVMDHPNYKHDSEVSDEIVYDLLKKMDSISNGEEHCEKLLGPFHPKSLSDL
ncbi:unnamed protein product [Caenorhabditis auriculariae]|uniref:Glutamate--cysteine ligase n=1 Tax=Caenorhabditis auriculariae TaxID=2777116 RepID=A0A8S1H718_9PELO|nr:unnamed protein product [Caenorhabditis auriculariae]